MESIKKSKSDMLEISVPKEWIQSFITAGQNYQNRIEYLEREEKISAYKLQRIRDTTMYDLEAGMEYFRTLLGVTKQEDTE